MNTKSKIFMLTIIILTLSTTCIMAYNEAPMLNNLVKLGELPSVDERLPVDPLVIEPYEEIGNYGGEINMTHMGPGDSTGFYRFIREPLVNYDEMLQEVNPNIVDTWEILDNGSRIRFHIREGLKWSDGHPFTSEDIRFWWEDYQLNRDLVPSVSDFYTYDGNSMKVNVVDEYTFEFKYDGPKAAIVNILAHGNLSYISAHYLKQFHKDYADPNELAAKVAAEGFNDWTELFRAKAGHSTSNIALGLPTVGAWVMKTDFSAPIMIIERNPYYFKVDPEGNQLPYIDRVNRELTNDVEVMVMKLISGKIDFQTRHLWSLYNKLPLFQQNTEQGDYRIIRTHGGNPGRITFFPNQNYTDDEYIGKLLKNKDFRIALSLGLDRHEINQIVFMGLGREVQGHSLPSDPTYVEEVDKMYIEQDLDKANQILDDLGLDNRDKDGYRLRPDGSRLQIVIDVSTHHIDLVQGTEIAADQWEKGLGIDMIINTMDRSLFNARYNDSKHQLATWSLTSGIAFTLSNDHAVNDVLGPLWYKWTLGEEGGVEPPSDVKRLDEIYNTLLPATQDTERRVSLARESLRIWGDNFWTVGVGGVSFNLAFAKNDLRGLPKDMAHSHPGNPGIWRPYVWYWDK